MLAQGALADAENLLMPALWCPLSPDRFAQVMQAHRGMERQLQRLRAAEARATAELAKARAQVRETAARAKRRAAEQVEAERRRAADRLEAPTGGQHPTGADRRA